MQRAEHCGDVVRVLLERERAVDVARVACACTSTAMTRRLRDSMGSTRLKFVPIVDPPPWMSTSGVPPAPWSS